MVDTFADSIRKIAREDKTKGALTEIEERPPITAMVNSPADEDKISQLKPPLTIEILTTETVRVYQNNDTESDNWVDVEKALTFVITDARNKKYNVDEITWPESE